MQNSCRTLRAALGKRFYAQRYKEGGKCPPCEPRKPPKLPMTARQVREKECHPCGYQWEEKEICEESSPPKKMMGNCKIPPCPPGTQTTVNQCAKKKEKECPRGDWNNPDVSRKN